MTTSIRRTGLAAALTIAAITVAACGGGTTSTAAPTDGSATAAPTTAPTDAAASVEPSSAIAIPSFDLSELVTNLENVDSYRLTIVSGGETAYSGMVVTRPVLSRDVTMGGQRFVIIGDEVWMGEGDQLVPAPAELAAGMLASFDPIVLMSAFAQPGAMTGAAEVGNEEKNGVSAKHYRIDASSIVGTLASMPPGSAIDVWIAEDGYLVSMAVSGMDADGFTMDVTNVNDPANVIERPS